MYSSKDYICTIIPDCAIAATTNTWLYTATAIIPEAKICTVVIQGGNRMLCQSLSSDDVK